MKSNRTKAMKLTAVILAIGSSAMLLSRRTNADNPRPERIRFGRQVVAVERFAIASSDNDALVLRGWTGGAVTFERELGLLPDAAIDRANGRVIIAERLVGDQARHDTLTSETISGEEIWSIPLVDDGGFRRMGYVGGGGPSSLVLDSTGKRLFVYMYRGHSSRVDLWETSSPTRLASSDVLSSCNAAELQFVVERNGLLLSCYGTNELVMLDGSTLTERWRHSMGTEIFARTGQPFNKIGGAIGALAGAVYLDSGTLLGVRDDGEAHIIDSQSGEELRRVQLASTSVPAVPQGMTGETSDGQLWIGWEPTEDGVTSVRRVKVYDTQSWQMTREVALPQAAAEIQWDDEGPIALTLDHSLIALQSTNSLLFPFADRSALRETEILIDGHKWSVRKLIR